MQECLLFCFATTQDKVFYATPPETYQLKRRCMELGAFLTSTHYKRYVAQVSEYNSLSPFLKSFRAKGGGDCATSALHYILTGQNQVEKASTFKQVNKILIQSLVF